MKQVRNLIIAICCLFAAFVVTRTARAQEDAGPPEVAIPVVAVNLVQQCMDECGKKLVMCASDVTNVKKLCPDVPACSLLNDAEADSVNIFCEQCLLSERGCSSGGPSRANKPADKPTEAPKTAPKKVDPNKKADTPKKPSPPPKPIKLTKEQLCKQEHGVMDGKVCKHLSDVEAEVKDLRDQLASISKRVDFQGDDIDKIRRRLEDLDKANGVPAALRKEIGDIIADLLDPLEKRVKSLEDHASDEDKEIHVLSQRIDVTNKYVGKLLRERGSTFAFQLNAVGSIHVLRPYDRTLFAAGGELVWLPGITPNWRGLAAVGGGYAGQTSDDQTLKALWLELGFQARLSRHMHLAFGGMTERRYNSFDTTKYATYAAFIEPKFCSGDKGPFAGTKTPAHEPSRFCLGLNAAAGATVFQGPLTRALFTGADLVLGLHVGYAFLP